MMKQVLLIATSLSILTSVAFADRTSMFPDTQCTAKGKTAAAGFCIDYSKGNYSHMQQNYAAPGQPEATAKPASNCTDGYSQVEFRAQCAYPIDPAHPTAGADWEITCSDLKNDSYKPCNP